VDPGAQRIKQALAASTPPPRHDHTTSPAWLLAWPRERANSGRARAKRTRGRNQPAVETRAAAAATGWHGSLSLPQPNQTSKPNHRPPRRRARETRDKQKGGDDQRRHALNPHHGHGVACKEQVAASQQIKERDPRGKNGYVQRTAAMAPKHKQTKHAPTPTTQRRPARR